MRYLAALIFLTVVPPLHALTIADLPIEHYPPYELVNEVKESLAGRHLLPMGALEVVQHELVPEQSETITGFKSSETYYLPDARHTDDVALFYREQLESLGQILYECEGRTCGSSFYWANTIFDLQVLYGPEQYQYYYIVRLAETAAYLKFYIGQRATRKIYVHAELVRQRTPD